MIMEKMSKDDLRWQAESDAETMARYNEIMADKARRERAIKAAKEKANNLMTRVTAMNKVIDNGKKK